MTTLSTQVAVKATIKDRGHVLHRPVVLLSAAPTAGDIREVVLDKIEETRIILGSSEFSRVHCIVTVSDHDTMKSE